MKSSAEISDAIAGHEAEVAAVTSALRVAEDQRSALLVTASNYEIELHDRGMAETRLAIERAAARANALRAELPGVEAAEEELRQQRVHAELSRMGARYREVIEREYPKSCEPLLNLLSELEAIDREVDALNKGVPGPLRVYPNEFREDRHNAYSVGRLHEKVVLPAVTQRGTAIWPLPRAVVRHHEPADKPPTRISEFAKEPIYSDARRGPSGIEYQRQSLAEWQHERDAQRTAEEQNRGGSQ